MHDDDMLEDSWFDRPAKGQPLTIEMVQAALRAPKKDEPPPEARAMEGLEDSWFERPARSRR